MNKNDTLFPQPNDETEKIANAYYKTNGGYQMDEVISALQKEIRRGNEENAVYWGLEILNTSGLEWKLWRRLKVISAEDCAGMLPALFIKEMEEMFYKIGKNCSDGKVIAVKAIIELSRGEKDRTADDMKAWWRENNKKLKIPEYALDKHTKNGRKQGKTIKDFREEGCKLKNESKLYNKKYLTFLKENHV